MAEAPGFFGKLPCRGDFVSRRLPADFIEAWDGWLQSAMAASQEALGGNWLDVYLTSPIWRFALAPGVAGEEGQIGVVMPSVDKVGRYFPLAVAAPSGFEGLPLAAASQLDDWFGEIESLVLATLDEAPLELEEFDERLVRLSLTPFAAVEGDAPFADGGGARAQTLWHCGLPLERSLRDAMLLAHSHLLGCRLERASVWWTQGSERVEPSLLVASGLPSHRAFTALLDGRWTEHGWASAVLDPKRTPPWRAGVRSASMTHPGKLRAANEDACASSDELGVWIVADGMGGHQAGDIASRMVTSTLAQLDRQGGLQRRVEQLSRALRVVNGCLQVLADRHAAVGLAGSTVVALIIEGDTAAWAWAGDSRIYRWRDGDLRQLSRDHSEAAFGAHNQHVITRAVGGPDDLDLEVESSGVRAGDRYLLSTDGMHGEIGEEAIAGALALAEPAGACARLREAVLAGEAPDNLTAIVVHVTDSMYSETTHV
jgi:type VI secretion system protein ImpM